MGWVENFFVFFGRSMTRSVTRVSHCLVYSKCILHFCFDAFLHILQWQPFQNLVLSKLFEKFYFMYLKICWKSRFFEDFLNNLILVISNIIDCH